MSINHDLVKKAIEDMRGDEEKMGIISQLIERMKESFTKEQLVEKFVTSVSDDKLDKMNRDEYKLVLMELFDQYFQ